MKKILNQLLQYAKQTNFTIFLLSTLTTALLVFLNYHWELYQQIKGLEGWLPYLAWYLVFLTGFAAGYFFYLIQNKPSDLPSKFILLLFLAPLIFAWKIAFPVKWVPEDHPYQDFWNQVIYWPFKLIITTMALWLVWKWQKSSEPFYGISLKQFRAAPYLTMLLLMVPLIALASTQADFLSTYPKLYNASLDATAPDYFLKVFLFELAYGSDFFTIEIFFRGFLVLAFARYVGINAILPMAMFYCTIHFGKPLGECISSYFGGIILGVVTYHTRSIWGGLIVHVGIAWLMELGGAIGNHWR